MSSFQGIAASSGVAFGDFYLLDSKIPETNAEKSKIGSLAEKGALKSAMKTVAEDLALRAERASGELKDILFAIAEFAEDPGLIEEAESFIERGQSASYAIQQAAQVFQALLSQSGGYLAERVSDIENIRDRIICEIEGVSYPEIPKQDNPIILVARDLSPADTIDLNASEILAIVTESGGPTSHTAIIARSMGIPAIVACIGVVEAARKSKGKKFAVDAINGQVFFDPSPLQVAEIAKMSERIQARKKLKVRKNADGFLTRDDHLIPIYANISRIDDVSAAITAKADGIGLLRTELFYLDRQEPPTLQEQSAIYAEMFTAFKGQKVVIRTLDAGADKPMAFINFDAEPNPALGVRGYRTINIHEDLLKTQLMAIAAATELSGAEVWVMAPMITTVDEAENFVKLCRSFGITRSGVMIEVPAAVFMADEIIKATDFLSIGTNDLGQYLHAADRESAALAHFNDPWQPALLKAVYEVAKAGLSGNCPVGICGEAASDPLLAAILIGLGVTSLSCNPLSIEDVAHGLTNLTIVQMQAAALKVLSQRSPESARSCARAYLPKLAELGL